MLILKSWIDSLKMFLPPKVLLLSFAIIKNCLALYHLIFSFFWGILFWVVFYFCFQFFSIHIISYIFLNSFIEFFKEYMTMIIVLFYILAVRSSLKRKNLNYFMSYSIHFWYLFLLVVPFAYFRASFYPILLLPFTLFVFCIFDSANFFYTMKKLFS